MENKIKEVKKAPRCRHCGGIISFSRGGSTCITCGRYPDHKCDNCKIKD